MLVLKIFAGRQKNLNKPHATLCSQSDMTASEMFPRFMSPEAPFLCPKASITAPITSSLTLFYVLLYVCGLRFPAHI
jgi:hypothetical protein